MKNLIKSALLAFGVLLTITSCSTDATTLTDAEMTNANLANKSENSKKQQTYQLKVGTIHNGVNYMNGSYDMGGIYATDVNTGIVYDGYITYSNGYAKLPGYFTDLPAGTYEISAYQGQGGWVGYGSTTVTLTPSSVGQDGYVNVYIPIAWEE
ncbi:hypothetical protein [Chryseobacterium indoltheticum]|uniref:Carboxypeptidase regulatory-like domain-containing protein n=1 Tax=Chryseobacterium indoltheticum TaxID=254 RepID=A0A3G6MUZ4_9FLAO|nr:hypothetical protein [Chryseobacterium indoltheticum]AZA59591.1 hypothetical protein EG340_00375 [Chryseobacterium indoltheticum]